MLPCILCKRALKKTMKGYSTTLLVLIVIFLYYLRYLGTDSKPSFVVSEKYHESDSIFPLVSIKQQKATDDSYCSNSTIFPSNIQPRLYQPIRNEFTYERLGLCPDPNTSPQKHGDFSIVIYSESSRKGWLIVRRLDDISWSFYLSVRIYSFLESETGQSDQIVLKPSQSSCSIVKFHTENITLQIDNSIYRQQLIPKVIIQTSHSLQVMNYYHINAFYTFVDLNPEYQVVIMTDQDCRGFLKKHFTRDVLTAFDVLVPGAFRADLFRYSVIYIVGGCYFDNKMIARQPLRKLFLPSDKLVLCSDRLQGGKMANRLDDTNKLYNAIICAKQKDPRLLKTIRNVVSYILKRKESVPGDNLSLTGPVAFYHSLKNDIFEDDIRLKHGYSPSWSIHPMRKYTDYYIISKLNNQLAFNKAFKDYYVLSRRDGSHYADLWNEGRIFFEYPSHISHYSIFFDSLSSTYYDFAIRNRTMFIHRKKWHRNWRSFLSSFKRPWIREDSSTDTTSSRYRLTVAFQGKNQVLSDCVVGSWKTQIHRAMHLNSSSSTDKIKQQLGKFEEKSILLVKIVDEDVNDDIILKVEAPEILPLLTIPMCLDY